ncbi:hypothetical protein NHQ30_010139 [Ciborinia camelliae]|nr:hypothetical protein NHQ30_010139 [Ciborinia camelliae]
MNMEIEEYFGSETGDDAHEVEEAGESPEGTPPPESSKPGQAQSSPQCNHVEPLKTKDEQ